jgi:hypothetical protein
MVDLLLLYIMTVKLTSIDFLNVSSIFQFLFLFSEQLGCYSEIATYAYICKDFSPKFSSISFKVSGLTLRYLIHLELIFVQDER